MSDRDKSKQQLIEELESLRREIAELKTTKTAFDAQNDLLRSLITMLQTATGKLMLRSMLQQILNVARGLTNAEEGSLFLLDANGTVTESILARGATIRGQKQRLVNEVLAKGLAGWVIQHREVGLIGDTTRDERWLTLPSQPYAAGSALCVPILNGKELLGIITLMHSQPEHFHPELVDLMKMTADQMALTLDNALLHTERQESASNKIAQQSHQEFSQVEEQLSNRDEFSQIGIYIIFWEGNFLYANPRMAEIFGYTFGELVSLESILDLVATDHRDLLAEKINLCLQGHSKNLCYMFQGQRKDDSRIDVEIYGTRTKLYGKFVIIGAVRVS